MFDENNFENNDGFSGVTEDSKSDFNNIPDTENTDELNENFTEPSKDNDDFKAEDTSNAIPPFAVIPKYKKSEKMQFTLPVVIIAVVLAAVIGAVSGIIAVNTTFDKNASDGAYDQSNGDNPVVNITVDETVNSTVEAVAEKVTPSVVGIRTTAAVTNFFGGQSNSTGEGSGIIYSADGYIITNYHVIESAVESANSSIEVYFASNTETSTSASVVGYNISYDLAVIKVEKSGLPAVQLADAAKIKVGQYVAAIGAPGGLEYMGSVTYGIISGLNRTVSSSASTDSKTVELVQTDAAINPGNSGGALVNMQGQLVGVNSEKIVSTSYEGMGFAIPVDTVKDICDKIIAKEYNPDPYIGITLSETWTPERLTSYGYPVGAVVKSVTSGGPAATAGIQSGDIITEFDSKSVTSYSDLNEMIQNAKVDSTVSIKIYRSGRYYSTNITVGSNNSQ